MTLILSGLVSKFILKFFAKSIFMKLEVAPESIITLASRALCPIPNNLFSVNCDPCAMSLIA